MEFKHIVMRILKNITEEQITSVGYNAVTKIEDTDEVEVEVRGTCNANGWIEQIIEETFTEEIIYKNGYTLF